MPDENYEILVEINANVAKAVSELEKVTGKMRTTEDSTMSLSRAFSTAAGVMLRDFVNGAMRSVVSSLDTASSEFQEYELTLTRIVGATSATGAEAEQLSEELRKVSLEQEALGYSGREAALALESLVKAGMSGAEAATSLESALMLARLESIDTSTAANYLVQTLTQFKLEAEDSYEALNLISKAADAGIGTANDYAAGLSNTGAAAANMGVSLQETLAALVILDKTFGSATESGTFLNMMFKDLIAKSGELGVSLYNADGSMRSLGDIVGQIKDKVAAFGTNQEAVNDYLSVFDVRAQRAIIGLLNYDGSIEEVMGTMDEARDVQDKFNMVMDTTTGQMATVEAALENASYELGEMAAGAELTWKQFALGLGPIGALADAMGPSLLQGAMTGLMFMLPKIWESLGDVSLKMGSLSLSGQTLALSVGAATAAFTGVYGILQMLPDDMQFAASVLAIISGSFVAATVAAAAFYGVVSMGVAVPVIIAGVSAAVAGVAVALQDAGVSADEFDKEISELGGTLSELERNVASATDKSADSLRELLVAAENYNYSLLDAESKTFLTYHHMLDDHNANIKGINEASYDELLAMYEEYAAKSGMSTEEYFSHISDVTDKSLSEQLAAIEANYSLRLATEEKWYDDEVQALEDYWLGLLETTETHQNTVIAAYMAHYADLESEAQASYDAAVDAAEAFFDLELSDATASLNELLAAYGLFYGDARSETEIYYDDVLAYINGFYDDKEADVDDALKEELDRIKTHYGQLLQDTNEAYSEQLDATRTFYDDQIDAINEGLAEIRGLRSDELDQMELDYLKERAALKEHLEANEIIQAEYEAAIEKLEDDYRTNRSVASEAWRLKELDYELTHKGELESLETAKNTAIEDLETTHKGNLETIETDKNTAITTAEEAHTTAMEGIYSERNSAIADVMELLEPILSAIQTRLETSLSDATTDFTEELEGLHDDRNETIGDVMGDFEGIATTHQGNLDTIERDRTVARTTVMGNAWKGLFGTFKTYAVNMEGVINGVEADVNAAKANITQALDVFNTAMNTMSAAPSASGFYPTGEQAIYDYAKSAYNKGDYNTYLGALQEMENRGYLSESERARYADAIPHGAEGGIVTEPTIMMVGEKGAEAIIPLDKATGYGGKIEIVVQVTGNTFSSTLDVEEAFSRGADTLARKLVSMGIGRLP